MRDKNKHCKYKNIKYFYLFFDNYTYIIIKNTKIDKSKFIFYFWHILYFFRIS